MLYWIVFLLCVIAIEKRADFKCELVIYCLLIYQIKLRDQDIHDKCLTECRLVYIDCLSSCESSFCDSACLQEFQGHINPFYQISDQFADCDAHCPCGLNCPSGCKGCDHPLCELSCEEPQINNDKYRLCINERIYELDLCLKSCTAEISCHNSCYESYVEKISSCTCMKDLVYTTSAPTLEPKQISAVIILYKIDGS